MPIKSAADCLDCARRCLEMAERHKDDANLKNHLIELATAWMRMPEELASEKDPAPGD
jgi:hypothetical protein